VVDGEVDRGVSAMGATASSPATQPLPFQLEVEMLPSREQLEDVDSTIHILQTNAVFEQETESSKTARTFLTLRLRQCALRRETLAIPALCRVSRTQ